MAQTAVNPQVTSFLKEMTRTWETTAKKAKETPRFQVHPDGLYLARLAGAEIRPSNDGSSVGCVWKYVIGAGPRTGKQISKYMNLSGERSLEFLAQELDAYGIDPTSVKPAQLPAVLANLVKSAPWVELKLQSYSKEGSSGQNVWLNDVKDADFTPDSEEEPETSEEAEEEEGAEPEEEDAGEEEEGEEEETEDGEEEEIEEEEAADAEPEEEEEGVEIEAGMECEYDWKGEKATGVIRELIEPDQVKVASDSDGKRVIRTLPVSEIVVLTEPLPAPAPAKRGPGRPKKS